MPLDKALDPDWLAHFSLGDLYDREDFAAQKAGCIDARRDPSDRVRWSCSARPAPSRHSFRTTSCTRFERCGDEEPFDCFTSLDKPLTVTMLNGRNLVRIVEAMAAEVEPGRDKLTAGFLSRSRTWSLQRNRARRSWCKCSGMRPPGTWRSFRC